MAQIDTTLSDEQLTNLRNAYSRPAMIELLTTGVPKRYRQTRGYIDAVGTAFYPDNDGGDTMAAKDRERCLIAILGSRDAGLNLSIHIYLGLMEGLLPREIADIIFLAGVYTGVDRMSDGLAALVATLNALAKLPKSSGPRAVLGALLNAFGPPWLPLANPE
jgi:alkylhydroperoxidase/carboxymuconolactone decarboxylase family protein YurZ